MKSSRTIKINKVKKKLPRLVEVEDPGESKAEAEAEATQGGGERWREEATRGRRKRRRRRNTRSRIGSRVRLLRKKMEQFRLRKKNEALTARSGGGEDYILGFFVIS